ncbi:ATP-binding cassette domain-containing protein [bacterium]|nr:ATP-binding cassette domain-containing protein [bacterium]
MIEVKDLKKDYKINIKKEGLTGAFISLFNPKYEIKHAVKGVNFSVEEGEMVGYIGANGAGKSTTIKMLTGILTPTSGEVIVNGLCPTKDRIKNNKKIGAVFGQRTQLWWDIPVIESYKLIQKIYELPDEDYKKNIEYFSKTLGLEELLKVPVRQLSLGQKMRCEIAAAFLPNPKIVYLDEPTIGLDFMVKEKIRKFIKQLNKEKKTTVILTTHDLQDIEEICSRIIIIDNGMIMFDGDLEEIRQEFSKFSVAKLLIKEITPELTDYLKKTEDFELLDIEENVLSIKFDRSKITIAGIFEKLASITSVLDLSIEEVSIETIVKTLYERKSTGV